MIFITISTVGLGDYTMSDDTLGSVGRDSNVAVPLRELHQNVMRVVALALTDSAHSVGGSLSHSSSGTSVM